MIEDPLSTSVASAGAIYPGSRPRAHALDRSATRPQEQAGSLRSLRLPVGGGGRRVRRIASYRDAFLTNRECPYRCLMCDLWKNTLDDRVPVGAIPAQIAWALERLPPTRQIKLYNAGSFFDNQAIPPRDDEAIARLVSGFERVIVECHPSLVGERCLQFAQRLSGKLEVALGLETVHGADA